MRPTTKLIRGEDGRFLHWNFDDCGQCKNKLKPRICADCAAGEDFELEDPLGVDDLFRN